MDQARANEFLEAELQGVKRIPFEKALHASTTHRHDYLNAYIADLGNVIDMDAIRGAKLRLGVDPLGGAGVHYWGPIAERYGLNLTVVNEAVDPTFRFMTVDWDGQIRMDPSSPYAMQRLIEMKDRFDLSFACDTDHDRHGIVTKSAGLLPPNHYLSVAILYLFQHRPKWHKEAAVGKTVVSSQMIDRVTAKLGRKLYEVPVGFKWFVDGLLDGSLGFGGEESAGASFSRLDGSVWTTDKDGIVPRLLAAEITARMGRDPGEIYRELTHEFGEPVYDRVEAPATPAQKELAAKLSPEQVKRRAGRGKNRDDPHPRARQRRAHRRVEGGGRRADGSPRVPQGPRISTRFMRRASGERTICAASWRRPRQLSATLEGDAPSGSGESRNEEQAMHRRSDPEAIRADGMKHETSVTCPGLPPSKRGIRFTGGAGPGHALVVESHHRRSMARARSRALGTHAKSLGGPPDGFARQTRARAG